MAIKSSGSSLAFSEIEDEFGQNGERSLGDYRISKTIGELANMPLDNGIPQSGQIKFSDFYTKKLNIVVDCHSGDTEARKNAKTDKWNNNEYDMVTNWSVAKPNSTNGKKIIIHVDKIFQSDAGNSPTDCALRTGTWNSGTTLQVDIGGEGRCYGAGGDGGDGADGRSDYGPVTNSVGDGQDGSSALGVEYSGATVNMLSGAQLIAGYGGGGGGQGGRQVDRGADRTSVGGGGGGGAGFPAGVGGSLGERLSGGEDEVATDGGGDGGDGTTTSGGAGGAGGDNIGETRGATGGVGGDSEQSAGAGGSVYNGKNTYGGNGAAGGSGAAIRRTSGITVTINTNGQTVNGSTTATGVT